MSTSIFLKADNLKSCVRGRNCNWGWWWPSRSDLTHRLVH